MSRKDEIFLHKLQPPSTINDEGGINDEFYDTFEDYYVMEQSNINGNTDQSAYIVSLFFFLLGTQIYYSKISFNIRLKKR